MNMSPHKAAKYLIPADNFPILIYNFTTQEFVRFYISPYGYRAAGVPYICQFK